MNHTTYEDLKAVARLPFAQALEELASDLRCGDEYEYPDEYE